MTNKILIGLVVAGVVVAVVIFWQRRASAHPYGNTPLGGSLQSLLSPHAQVPPPPPPVKPTTGSGGRSGVKTAVDIGVTAYCSAQTGGAGAPLCAAVAPVATDIASGVVNKTKNVISGAASKIKGWF